MARTAAVNFTGPLQFPYATSATDLFKKEDVQTVAVAVDAHDHTTGKGLPVGALAATVTVPAGGTSLTGGTVFLASNSGSYGNLAINAGRASNGAISWYGAVAGDDMLLYNGAGGTLNIRSPGAMSFQDNAGTVRMLLGIGGALSCGSNMTLNTLRGANAGSLVMQAGIGGSANDVQMFSENGNTLLWFTNAAGGLVIQTTGGGAFRPVTASAFTVGSSKVYKENLNVLDQATMLAQVMDPQVQPISYSLIGSGDESIGFLAEDMINVVPEAVSLNEEGAPQGINYNALVPILWGAVRELNDRLKPPA